ncbi:hypothetical protein, partial [Caldimonas tepidiphila]|uniref:hypothetical protein n=1 Tax=Caldimonas tepidiphila TaxID=2315841 RepID=UPI0013004C4C
MPVITTLEPGKVTSISGQAQLRLPDGSTRVLRVGDDIKLGDVILTQQDGIVEIQRDAVAKAEPKPDNEIDRVIQALESSDPQAVPAAGVAAVGGAAAPALRVERIVETVEAGASTRAALMERAAPVEFGTGSIAQGEAPGSPGRSNAPAVLGSADVTLDETDTALTT